MKKWEIENPMDATDWLDMLVNAFETLEFAGELKVKNDDDEFETRQLYSDKRNIELEGIIPLADAMGYKLTYKSTPCDNISHVGFEYKGWFFFETRFTR